jgi:hypothetical protein
MNCNWLAATVAAVVAAPAWGQTGGPDVRVNQDAPGTVQNETSLTLNPATPGNLVMAYNDRPWAGVCPGLGISFSNDFGTTWTDRQLFLPTVPFVAVDAFDPCIVANTQGDVIAAHVSTDGVLGGNSAIFIFPSADGGNTWPAYADVGHRIGPLNDKPHLAVDDHPGSVFQDRLYLAWLRDFATSGPFGDIWFAHTLQPGQIVFQPPQQISDPPPGQGRGNGPNVAVACDGTVYVAWLDCDVTISPEQPWPGTLFIDRSFDGGVTWGADMVAVPTIWCVRGHFRDLQSPMQLDARARSYPCIATSPFNPLEIYMVYAECVMPETITNEADVFFTSSLDGGLTWSPPVCIHAPWHQSGAQFEPWIRVKPSGVIDVAYYDSQFVDPGMALWSVVLTTSVDGGMTWSPPAPISDVSREAPREPFAGEKWLGEYLALAVDSNMAYIGWTSRGFTGPGDDLRGDIWFDRVPNEGPPCPGDADGNGFVDVDDLLMVIMQWGPCPGCPADVIPDGVVDVDDLLLVIMRWGPC